MKFVAKSLIDNLLQSAIKQTTGMLSISEPIAQRTMVTMNHHIDSENQDASVWHHIHDQIAIHLRNFAHAKARSNEQAAQLAEQEFDSLLGQLEFPWQEAKQLFIKYYQMSTKLVYRDWQFFGKNDLNFGMITHQINPDAKIAVIGDWGTGGSDAFALLDQLLNYKDKPDVILHLGDIYHSCTEDEMKDNFLHPFENAFKKVGYRVPVYTIPGNHDYYVGGQPFYDLIDQINQPLGVEYQQQASYFCLRTSDNSWQLLGADTGINDPNSVIHVRAPSLKPSELSWHKDKFQNFSGKTLFMTHHPLIEATNSLSSHESNNNLYPFNQDLLAQLGSEFGDASGQIPAKMDLWLWGHDHYFVPFKTDISVPENRIVPKSRLLGGSARETGDIKKDEHGRIKNQHLIQQDEQGNLILPNHNNNYINHTWCLIDLGTQKIKYFQMPAWNEDGPAKQNTSLPPDQPLVFFEEDI